MRASLASLRHSLVTAALLALLGLAGWSLYVTGWNEGYEEAVQEIDAAAEHDEVRA